MRLFVSRVKCERCKNETIIAHTDKEAICPTCKSKCSVLKVLYEPQTPIPVSVSDKGPEYFGDREDDGKKIGALFPKSDLSPRNNN